MIIGASPALQVREREIVARYTKRLAELQATETGADQDDVQSWAVAGGLMEAHRALVRYVRGSVMAGRSGPRLAADARAQARRAFAPMERGLANYARRNRDV